ncbi:MAG: substrate-binding domain-containing protein, partial [Cellulomonadaceae bacterium]
VAYEQALRDAGLTVDPTLIEVAPTEHHGADRAAARLFDRTDRPTAIFCFNDERAAGVYREATRRGLQIPRDLSVVGFDNLELIAEQLEPPLTTIQLPHVEMGRWAVEVAIGARTETGPFPVRQPCPLVERNSVGPPPAD